MNTEKRKSKLGKHVEFTAERILKGNPVTGTMVSNDEEWITVVLTKDIEGLVNVWYAGEKVSFRKSLIRGEIKIIKPLKP
jgi:hypothetical protein